MRLVTLVCPFPLSRSPLHRSSEPLLFPWHGEVSSLLEEEVCTPFNWRCYGDGRACVLPHMYVRTECVWTCACASLRKYMHELCVCACVRMCKLINCQAHEQSLNSVSLSLFLCCHGYWSGGAGKPTVYDGDILPCLHDLVWSMGWGERAGGRYHGPVGMGMIGQGSVDWCCPPVS